MGKEFELKYAATAAQLDILKARYPHLRPIAMETAYYDNAAGDFSRRKWTFRRRMENGKSICTLKTPMAGHGRAEFETECADLLEAVPKLIEQGAPEELAALVAGGIAESCGAKFTRLAGLLELPGCTAELALDVGVLLGGGKELPFREVEVELKEGSEEAVTAFAEALAAELSLVAEPKSKVARARQLVQEKNIPQLSTAPLKAPLCKGSCQRS